MRTVAFVHQKGGTGKTTLAIGTAIVLAKSGARVLLLDADVQGTASEWGSRWGERWKVVTRSQMQPIIHEQAARFERTFEWMIVDGPPTLSEMTSSILRAADGVVVPVRSSLPDIWVLDGLAALQRQLCGEGSEPSIMVVWNQMIEPQTDAMTAHVKTLQLSVSPHMIGRDSAWTHLMEGAAVPNDEAEHLRSLAMGISL
ncbi:MAG: ParA family protein [Nitrospirota bacterium]|nr:ParA family protein [Nitrospirota bacterium]